MRRRLFTILATSVAMSASAIGGTLATTGPSAASARPPASHSAGSAVIEHTAGSAVIEHTAGSAVIEHSGGSFPVTIPTQYGDVRIPRRPTRIISLSPTTTEMLFAIGAGHQVVAVDSDSNFPSAAPKTSLSGYTPNVEAIARYRPDLVVISYNPSHPDLVSALRLLGIPTLYVPAAADLAQTYGEIATLGRVTGDITSAQHEIASMRTQIAALLTTVVHRSKPLSYFYEIGNAPLYTATTDTFIGSVLRLAGLRNIAGASIAGSDYPEFSSEVVVRDNPTFVFVADGASIRSIASRPGWNTLSAVRHHRVVELDQDVASRWGPRIVDLLRAVIHAVDAVRAAPAA